MSKAKPLQTWVVALMLGVSLSFFGGDIARADSDHVKSLLDAGWKVSIATRDAADKMYRKAVADGAFDGDLVNAITLIRIRQRQYRPALESAEQWTKISDSMEAHLSRTWLATMIRDYEKSLVFIEGTAARIAKSPEAERGTPAESLGRIVGYLECIDAKGVTIEQVRASADRAEAALGAAASAFLDSRRAVVRKHHALIVRKDATVAETEAAGAAERERKLREIARRKDALEARRGELAENQDRLAEELQKKLDEVNARLRPLDRQRAEVDADGRSVNYTLADIVSEIRYLESLLDLVHDPVLRDRYYREILRLDRLALQYESDAYRLERRRYSLDVERAGIAADGAVARNRTGKALNRTEDELEKVKKQEKRTRIEEKRARRPDRAASRQSRVMKAQIQSFSTYAPFPLEQSKADLLKRVEAKVK